MPDARFISHCTHWLACSCTAMAAMAFAQSGLAQTTPAPGSETPGSVTPGSGASSAAASSSDAAPVQAFSGDTLVSMNFQDADLASVLTYLSAEAGLVILNAQDINAKVNLISEQPVRLDEAIDLINSMLKDYDMTAVRRGRLMRIIPIGQAKGDSIPVRYGNDPSKIGETDTIITQVIPVKYADANEIQDDLEELVSGTYAEFTANEASNALILTDTEANIRRIVEIVSALDQFISNDTEVRVFKLTHADASDTATLIETTFQRSENGQNNMARMIQERFRRGGGREGDQDAGGQAQSSQVVASADERTNSVVVSAGSEVLDAIAALIEQLDTDSSVQATVSVKVFALEFADATDTARLIEETFADAGTAAQNAQGRNVQRNFGGFRGRDNEQTATTGGDDVIPVTAAADERTNSIVVSASEEMIPVIEGIIMELDANTVANESVWVYQVRHGDAEVLEEVLTNLFEENNNTGGGSGDDNTQRQQIAGRGGNAAGQTTSTDGISMAGQVTVVADPDTNSLVFMTAERFFPRLETIMEELDRPVEQVLIRVLIAEVTVDDSKDLGVEWEVLDLPNFMSELFTDFGVDAASNGMKVGFLDQGSFSAAVRMLQEVGSLDILSRPYILASDNQEASISVGESVPFVTDSRVTDTGQTINTIDYRDLGIIVNVTPRINSRDQVTLDINQELSALTGETVQISEVLDASVVGQRIAETRAAVLNGQTIVIGGLMEDQYRVTTDQVPVLGDIPVLGYLFKRERTIKSKTELLIFLTPEIVAEPSELDAITQDIKNGAKAAQNAIDTGVLQDHLDRLKSARKRALEAGATPREGEPGYVVYVEAEGDEASTATDNTAGERADDASDSTQGNQ